MTVTLLAAALALAASLPYPQARRSDQVDVYHGESVPDPYRWLEDTGSEETRAWIEDENRVTFAYLETLPARAALRARFTKLWDYPKYSPPVAARGRYFFTKNDGLQNQAVLYWRESLSGEPRVLIDPNTLSADGTVALSSWNPTEDGRLLAYTLSESGSDWQTIHVREVASGKDKDDAVRWVKFSGAAWTRDQKGFFYGRYPEPKTGAKFVQANKDRRLHYHRLGTPQSADVLIWENPREPDWHAGVTVSDDGRYAVISITRGGPRNRVSYVDLQFPRRPDLKQPVVPLIEDFEASWSFVGNDGPVFYFETDAGAANGQVVAIDIDKPEKRRTWIAETTDALRDVSLVGDHFVCSYLHDAHGQAVIHDRRGRALRDLALPGIGTVSGLQGRRWDRETFYSFTSYVEPATIYRYDLTRDASSVLHRPQVDFDPSAYETRQVRYASKDGTKVPMFVTARKGLPLDGKRPAYLYGYGGFRVSMTPSFSVGPLPWLEMGGIYAVANLRGGGEYGEAWHSAGTKERKQNVFDDFIAAAEFLIKEGYTSSSKLVIAGGSNGGLLVGAVMNQRPDLLAAALPAVGVMDMLRYHTFTIGQAWSYDYGTSDDSTMYQALKAYSPLHNLKPGARYPPVLVTTADHDDRVVPGHSFKYAAALQAAQAGEAPVLIRIETKAGHGAGKPTTKAIEEAADRWAFAMRHAGMDFIAP